MDFSKIDLAAASKRGADCHIEHPVTRKRLYDDEGNPVTIRVLGIDSPEFRSAMARASNGISPTAGDNPLDTAEEAAVEMLCSMIVGWNGIQWEGAPMECTLQNKRKLLKSFRPLRAQLDAFISERANFFTSDELK